MKFLPIALSLLALVLTSVPGGAQTYENDSLGSTLERPRDLTVLNGAVVSESLEPDGRTRMTVTCDIQNSGDGKWSFACVGLEPAEGAEVQVPNGFTFDDIEPQGSASPELGLPVEVLVEAAVLAAYRESILDNSRFFVSGGKELWQLNVPVVAVNDGNFGIIDGELSETSNFLDLSTGDGESIFRYAISGVDDFGDSWVQAADDLRDQEMRDILIVAEDTDALSQTYLDRNDEVQIGPSLALPVLYGSLQRSFAIPPFGDWITVQGDKVSPEDIFDLIEYGTFVIDETLPGSAGVPLTLATQEGSDNDPMDDRRGLPESISNTGGDLDVSMVPNLDPDGKLKAIPLHFDKLRIGDKITVSGSFVLKAVPLAMDLRIRPGGSDIEITTGVAAEANLLIETTGNVDTTFLAEKDQVIKLLDLDVFKIPIETPLVTFYVTPNIQFEVGASVRGAAGMSIPLSVRTEATVTFGWRDGAFFNDPPEVNLEQPEISNLSTYVESEAVARIWAESRLTVNISTDPEELTANSSPQVSLRAEGTLTVDPTENPWWSMEGKLIANAAFELNALGFEVARVDADLGEWDLFSLAAGGPLIGAGAGEKKNETASGYNPGVRQLGNGRSRWGRLLDYRNVTSGTTLNHLDILPVAGSEDILFGGSGSFSTGCVHRVGPRGEWFWAISFDHPSALAPRGFVAEPDGGFTAGGYPGLSLQRFDSGGNLLWATRWDPPGTWGIELDDVVRHENSAGEAEYFLIGHADEGAVQKDDGFLAKIDATGTLVWAKTYGTPAAESEEDRRFTTGMIASDGNLILAGEASKLTPPALIIGGFLLKIDPEDGSVIWDSGLTAPRSLLMTSLAESPDGTIYVAGGQFKVVGDDAGGIIVSKYSAGGELALVTRIEKESAVTGEYPSNGLSAYDTARDIVWTNDGLWMCGNLDARGSVGSSGFVTRLDENLGVTRHIVLGGSRTDDLDAILPHDQGFYVGGYTKSFDPWPAADSVLPRADQWLLSLPWDGMMRYHDQTTAAQPGSGNTETEGAYFLWPEVWNSTDHLQVDVNTEVMDLVFTAGAAAIAPVFVTDVEVKALEQVPDQALDSYRNFVDHQQYEGGDPSNAPDRDGDGINDAMERFFGTNPDEADATSPVKLEVNEDQGTMQIVFTRSRDAEDAEPILQVSSDLITWELREDWTLQSQPQSPEIDLVRLRMNLDDADGLLFFRLAVPEVE